MSVQEEALGQLFEIAKKTRTPISCTIELTEKCNFKCSHCFVKGIGVHELSYKSFVSFINQFKENGGIYLTLTGGEVLTHPNFIEMYTYAHKKGLAITIFTNGYLINQQILEVFLKFPPRKIEISIYGASDDTYQKVTTYKNAFSIISNNINLLLENKLNVYLKTTLYSVNYDDFDNIKLFANAYNLRFKYDFKLFPKRNGDFSNLIYQISPNKIIDLEIKDNKKKLWEENYHRKKNKYPNQILFECGAGRYSCFLSSRNQLRICAAATFSSVNMDNMTFKDAWSKFEKYTKLKVNPNSKCIDCEKSYLCDICPIWGFVMNNNIGLLGMETDLHCALAEERMRVIKNA